MLTTAFSRALKNLTLPGILVLFLYCLLGYGIGWFALSLLLGALISGYIGLSGADGFVVQFIANAGGWVLAWFLFPLLYPVLMSFFDERVAETIEAQDYPGLPDATPPFWPTFWADARFALKAIGLNILCLPLYLIPLVNVLVYYGMNGYLLGSQFFRMAAGRRVGKVQCEQLLKQHRMTIILAGALISLCATIPILNLAAPMLGVATLLHLYHLIVGTAKQELLTA